MKVEVLKSPHPFAANTYLISSLNEYAVVDPTAPFTSDICDGKVKYILLTHAHFDHILEVDSWVKGSGAEVICSKDAKDALSDPMKNCFKLYDGSDNGYFGDARAIDEDEELTLGEKTIRIINCPGHTAGSATFVIDQIAFVGDTVFEGGGFGRYDLPTGNLVFLKDSIRRLMTLADDTVLYPGHGQSTTVAQYKKDIHFR